MVMGYKKRSAIAKLRQDIWNDALTCLMSSVYHHFIKYRICSGNSLALELLGEWYVGGSCFTRGTNLPSERLCQLSQGCFGNCYGDESRLSFIG